MWSLRVTASWFFISLSLLLSLPSFIAFQFHLQSYYIFFSVVLSIFSPLSSSQSTFPQHANLLLPSARPLSHNRTVDRPAPLVLLLWEIHVFIVECYIDSLNFTSRINKALFYPIYFISYQSTLWLWSLWYLTVKSMKSRLLSNTILPHCSLKWVKTLHIYLFSQKTKKEIASMIWC